MQRQAHLLHCCAPPGRPGCPMWHAAPIALSWIPSPHSEAHSKGRRPTIHCTVDSKQSRSLLLMLLLLLLR